MGVIDKATEGAGTGSAGGLVGAGAGAVIGGVAGLIGGKAKDDANKQAYAKRLDLFKNMLRGAAFTGHYPDINMVGNEPDSSGLWSGLVGGGSAGWNAGKSITDLYTGKTNKKEEELDNNTQAIIKAIKDKKAGNNDAGNPFGNMG